MEYKVAYNACYGGYNFSDKAIEWFNQEYGTNYQYRHELADLPRHDPRIIECIETLGSDAGGSCSHLKIKVIDCPMYFIDEYDGSESVVEPDTLNWINIE